MPIRRADSALLSFARTFGGLTLLTVGFVATVGTILGFFGSAWWMFDVMAAYRMQFAVVLVVAGILYGLILGRVTSVIFLLAAVANIVVIMPLYLDKPAAAADAGFVDVASINVRSAGIGRDAVFNWIQRSNADLVFLFETSDAWVDEIGAAGLGYRITSEIPPNRVYGVTVLARDTLAIDPVRAGENDDLVVRTETSVGGLDVVVYAVQPREPTSEENSRARDQVLEFVARRAEDETLPVIVVGTLNASPWSHAFRNLMSTADLIDSERGYGFHPTWPAARWTGLAIPANHLLHSPELTTTDRLVGPDLGSNQKPILVRVARTRS